MNEAKQERLCAAILEQDREQIFSAVQMAGVAHMRIFIDSVRVRREVRASSGEMFHVELDARICKSNHVHIDCTVNPFKAAMLLAGRDM